MSETKTKMNLKPLADRVVLEVVEDNEQTTGGIYIPDTAREKPIKGRVVAVGDGRIENGNKIEMTVQVGDIVLFAKYGGTEVKLDNQEYKIMSEKDILAIIQQ